MSIAFRSVTLARFSSVIVAGLLVAGCQEKVITIGTSSDNVPVESTGNTNASIEVQQLKAQLQTLKTELEKNSKDFASYKTSVRQAFKKIAVGLKLGDMQMNGEELKNVIVSNVEETALKVTHDKGSTTIPLSALDDQLRMLFDSVEFQPTEKRENLLPTVGNLLAKEVTKVFKPESLVFFSTGEGGSGSGFIVQTGDGVYVYTNAHVLCGTLDVGFEKGLLSTVISTASGTVIPFPSEIELSGTFNYNDDFGLQDLARFKVDGSNLVAYELLREDEKLNFDDKIIAYGNSNGGGVITDLPGNINGVGGDRIEITCQIVRGNSGGSIVSPNSGRVVGVSTYGFQKPTTVWNEGTRFEKLRRFALRPEKVTNWRKMKAADLHKLLLKFDDYLADTRSVEVAAAMDLNDDLRGFLPVVIVRGNFDFNRLLLEPHPSDLSRMISANTKGVNDRFSDMGKDLSLDARKSAFSDYYIKIKNASTNQTQSFNRNDYPPYLQQFVKSLLNLRKSAHQNIDYKKRYMEDRLNSAVITKPRVVKERKKSEPIRKYKISVE